MLTFSFKIDKSMIDHEGNTEDMIHPIHMSAVLKKSGDPHTSGHLHDGTCHEANLYVLMFSVVDIILKTC